MRDRIGSGRIGNKAAVISGAVALAVSGMAVKALGQVQLLQNPGFEAPIDDTGATSDSTANGWTFYGGAARASYYNNTSGGKWSAWLQPFNGPGGVYQDYSGPVTSGSTYTLSAYWLFEPNFPGVGAIPDMQIDFENASGNGVGPDSGYGPGVYQLNLDPSTVIADKTWNQFSMTAVAPVGATQIIAEFDISEQTGMATSQESAFVDDANLIGQGVSPIPQWALKGSGDWNVGQNWSTGNSPAGVDGDAEFLGSITANSNVYSDVAVTEGLIHFNNAFTYVLDGAGSLTLQTSTGNAAVNVDKGIQEINLPTTIASNTVFTVAPSSTLVIGNPLTINSGKTLSSTGGGTVVYESIVNVGSGASIAFGNSTHANALSIASTGSATVGGTGSTLEVDNLSNAGTINLMTNAMIINYGSGADPIAAVKAEIASAYANGTWTGPGITSSNAQSQPGTYGVGYADAADPGNPAGLASGQIEVMYTLLGDANLDKKVNGTDFAILASHFNQGVNGWDQGDFNFDNKANGIDFTEMAANFNQGLSGAADMQALDEFAAANGISLASVPEPATLGLLLLGGVGILGKRRRNFIA